MRSKIISAFTIVLCSLLVGCSYDSIKTVCTLCQGLADVKKEVYSHTFIDRFQNDLKVLGLNNYGTEKGNAVIDTLVKFCNAVSILIGSKVDIDPSAAVAASESFTKLTDDEADASKQISSTISDLLMNKYKVKELGKVLKSNCSALITLSTSLHIELQAKYNLVIRIQEAAARKQDSVISDKQSRRLLAKESLNQLFYNELLDNYKSKGDLLCLEINRVKSFLIALKILCNQEMPSGNLGRKKSDKKFDKLMHDSVQKQIRPCNSL